MIGTGKFINHKWVNIQSFQETTNEPRREKTNVPHMQKQRRRSASRLREADQGLCFRCLDSTIPLLPKYEISSL